MKVRNGKLAIEDIKDEDVKDGKIAIESIPAQWRIKVQEKVNEVK